MWTPEKPYSLDMQVNIHSPSEYTRAFCQFQPVRRVLATQAWLVGRPPQPICSAGVAHKKYVFLKLRDFSGAGQKFYQNRDKNSFCNRDGPFIVGNKNFTFYRATHSMNCLRKKQSQRKHEIFYSSPLMPKVKASGHPHRT